MKNRKRLLAIGCVLIATLAISTVAFTIMQGRALIGTEPTSLNEIINYPGTAALYELPESSKREEMLNLKEHGTLLGYPLKGYNDMRELLASKGYVFTDSFFDVFIEDVSLTTPQEETYMGRTYMQWSEMGPNGTKALLTGAVMLSGLPPFENSSILISVVTNVLPPHEMPGVDPYIIWNAEPYFFIQFYWWHPWYHPPYWKIIHWKYWWYDSHKSPNWFWGPYWWWRRYFSNYYYYAWKWYPWYWWWWHWYYWRGWYWWSTQWPY